MRVRLKHPDDQQHNDGQQDQLDDHALKIATTHDERYRPDRGDT